MVRLVFSMFVVLACEQAAPENARVATSIGDENSARYQTGANDTKASPNQDRQIGASPKSPDIRYVSVGFGGEKLGLTDSTLHLCFRT
jgi:hypothetical protein